MIRFNNKKMKNINGNVTILVLIMSMVIIISMVTLTGYMFRDIIFTRYDEGKFKALNIAEAGLADVYSKIEEYYKEETTSLPPTNYTRDVANSEGEVQGSFEITYDTVENDDGVLTNFIINSLGTDAESGETREVQVNLGVSFSTEVNIFDYIYSRGSIIFDDLTIIEGNPFFNGPTYIRGNVTLRLLEGRFFSGEGKILIGGNLDMGEFAELNSGPVNVGGNVEMSGRAYLEHDFDDYMIVMKDIRMKGNSQIGKSSGNPINLCCEGTISLEGGANLYYDPPLGNDIFDPPNFDVSVYVNNFITKIQDPPINYLEIDESEDGNEDGVFVIDPELILAAVPPVVNDEMDESVKLVTNEYILVSKSASPNPAEVGDEITYSYTVTNISSAILTDVNCVDSSLGAVTLIGLTDEDSDGNDDDLAIGAAATGTLNYTVITGDLPGPIDNTVEATADTALEPDPVIDTADESVKLVTNEYILVSKSASPNPAEVGDEITYSYTVTNISSAILTDVNCVDSSLGAVTLIGLTDEDSDGNDDDLAIGAAATGTLNYTVITGDLPGPIENNAIAGCIPMSPADEFYKVNGDNSIKFYEDSGSYYLEVEGNILINGDIRIGEYIEDSNIDPPDNDIYYSGKGKLITTGNIDASCGLVPTDVDDFPEDNLLILMTSGNLDISINNDSKCYNNFYGDYEDPDLYILGMAGGTVTLSRHTAILGSILAGQIDAVDLNGILGWLIGSFATIGYQDGLSNNVPDDMPMLYYGGATFTEEWQEIIE